MTLFTTTQIAQFICDNYERANEWPFDDLCELIKFFMKEDFCLLVGEKDQLLGVVLVRPTMEPWNCLNNTDYDHEGDTLLIDIAVAKSPKVMVMQSLGFAILKRFGERSKLAFQRHGVGPLIITDMKRHRARLLRERKICK